MEVGEINMFVFVPFDLSLENNPFFGFRHSSNCLTEHFNSK